MRYQLLVYPCTDMEPSKWPSMSETKNGYFLTTDSMAWFYDRYVPAGIDRNDPRISPARATLEGLPPAYLLTAEFDPLRDEGDEQVLDDRQPRTRNLRRQLAPEALGQTQVELAHRDERRHRDGAHTVVGVVLEQCVGLAAERH